MEQAGLWQHTALLVSADHGWRTSYWRGGTDWTAEDEAVSHVDTSGVPFLLRLPGQESGVTYEKRFRTILTRTLIDEILAGRLSDARDVTDPYLLLQLRREKGLDLSPQL